MPASGADFSPASINDDAADTSLPVGFASEIYGGSHFADDVIV